MQFPALDAIAFNLVDLGLVAVVLLGILRGWQRGFVTGVVELICLAGSLVAAFFATPVLAQALDGKAWLPEPWASPAVFLLVFVVAQIAIGNVLRRLLLPAMYRMAGTTAGKIDRFFGILPGVANGAINAMVVAVLLTALPLTDGITKSTQDSELVAKLGVPAEWLERRLGPIFNPAVERTMQALTVAPESKERIALPFVVRNPPPRPELEAAMLVLVNQERVKAGVRPLVADPETVEVSRDHSRDMFARSYFAHETPEGKTPFDRLRAARLTYRAAGENLALARTLDMAHQGLMKSPGHRANILYPSFGRLGIGIVDGGRHGLMITQTFRN